MTDNKTIEAALDTWFRGIRWQELSIPSQESLCINMRAAIAAADKVRAEGFDLAKATAEIWSSPIRDTERKVREIFAAGLAKSEAAIAALVQALEAVELTPGGFINFKRSIPRTQYGALNIGGSSLVRSAIEGWFEERDAALALVRKGEQPDPRGPDYSRLGVFATHNCWKCKDGKEPCIVGNPRNCENLHARND